MMESWHSEGAAPTTQGLPFPSRALQPSGVQDLVAHPPGEACPERQRVSMLLISVQENERRRIAFDLHDGVGQSLSLLKLSVEKSTRLVRQGAMREAEQILHELSSRIDEALAEVRRVAMELRPPMLEDLGLLPTLSWLLREFEQSAGGIFLVRTITVAEQDVPRELQTTIFRILQEALHNVTKHAGANLVHVRLQRVGKALRLSVEDDGCGFDPQAVRCTDSNAGGAGAPQHEGTRQCHRRIVQPAFGFRPRHDHHGHLALSASVRLEIHTTTEDRILPCTHPSPPRAGLPSRLYRHELPCAPEAARMNMKHRIFIVDDHALLRTALRALLSQDPDIDVVGEADNGHDAISGVTRTSPHLVLMDISMRGMSGIETIVDLKRRCAGVRLLVLTMHRADEYITASLRAGADGYMLKEGTHEELQMAVRSILRGKTYLSPEISGGVINVFLGNNQPTTASNTWDTLTHREREILKLIAEGHSNKSIAKYFSLSIKTVEKHRSNLMRKLDLHNVAMLTNYAIQRGLVVE